MKYYLSFSLLEALIFGEKQEKENLQTQILELLKKDSRFFTSSFTLANLIKANLEYGNKIFHELSTLCEEILPFNSEDLKLAISLQREHSLTQSQSIDLAIAIKTSDCILGLNEAFQNQKLIRFISLSSKSKVNRL